jgi:hypothetical protein
VGWASGPPSDSAAPEDACAPPDASQLYPPDFPRRARNLSTTSAATLLDAAGVEHPHDPPEAAAAATPFDAKYRSTAETTSARLTGAPTPPPSGAFV